MRTSPLIPFVRSSGQGAPRADKTLDECRQIRATGENLEAVAAVHGVNVRNWGGSRVVSEHRDVAETVSVPARRPLKSVYVRRFVALIEAVRASNG